MLLPDGWRPGDDDDDVKEHVYEAYKLARDNPSRAYCIEDTRDPLTPIVWLSVDQRAPFTMPEGIERL